MQQVDGRLFSGGLDQDSDPTIVSLDDYIDAQDIYNGYGENVGTITFGKGSTALNFSMPSGTNLCVGTCEDKQNAAAIFFFHNSLGNHQIIRYSAQSQSLFLLAKGSALGFSASRKISHSYVVDGTLLYWTDTTTAGTTIAGNPPYCLDITRGFQIKQHTYEIYAGIAGEGQFANGSTYTFQRQQVDGTADGPTYVFTADGTYLNNPVGGLGWLADQIIASMSAIVSVSECDGCKIGITVTLSTRRLSLVASAGDVVMVGKNNYPVTLAQHHIDMLKQPGHCAPSATYAADPTYKSNNVVNLCAQFIVRYVYYNNERSAWSPVSNVALNVGIDGLTLPGLNTIKVNFTDPRLSDPSWLCMIKAVEVGFRDTNIENFRLIDRYPVCELGLDSQFIIFRNDKLYQTIPSDENTSADVQALKPYDHIPIMTGTMEASADEAGGAITFMGATLEGYDCPDCVDLLMSADAYDGTNAYNDACLIDITGTVQVINNAAYPSANPDFEYYPLDGFVVYLAGTPFYAISNNPAAGGGDGSFTIKGVPRGKYLLRVASFKCSFGSALSPRYDMSNGYEWQRTSSPLIAICNGPAPLINDGSFAYYNLVQEFVVNLTAVVGPTYNIVTSNPPGLIQIQNQHWSKRYANIANGITGVTMVEGYLLDNDATNPNNAARIGAINVERQMVIDTRPAPDVGKFTDHNGYFYFIYARVKPLTDDWFFSVADDAASANIDSYSGDFMALYNNTLTVVGTGPGSFSGLGPQTLILINRDAWITGRKKTVSALALDAASTPLSGVIFNYARNVRSQITGASGLVYFTAYVPWGYPTIPTVRNDDGLYALYLNDSCYTGYPATNPKILTIDVTVPGTYAAPNFLFTFIGVVSFNTRFLKGGGVYDFGIVYEDRGNRTCGVVRGVKLTIPFHPAPGGLVRWRASWIINSQPPIWATHYRFVRTKNAIEKYYVQWSVLSVIWAKITSPLEDPIITSFANGDATHIFLELYVPPVPDTATAYYFPFFQENGQFSYTPEPGDRVRFILNDQGDPLTTTTQYYEAPVVGKYVDGDKIYASIPNVFGTLEVKANFLAEYYQPAPGTDEIYYEGGEDCYEILNPGLSNRYHAGPIQNQTASLPARGFIVGGDTFFRYDSFTGTSAVATEHAVPRDNMDGTEQCQDIGRPFVLTPDDAQIFFYNRVRFSGKYLQSSLINGLSSFRGTDYQDINRQWGCITWMGFANNVLLAVCRYKIQPIYINRKRLMTLDGDNSVGRSTKVLEIADESVMPYGTSNPESVQVENGYVYGWDKYQAVVWRYATNGVEPIITKMVKYFRQKALERQPFVGDFVVGGYDRRHAMYLLTFVGSGEVLASDTIGFDEIKNRWVSRYRFQPEYYARVGNDLLAGKSNAIHLFFQTTAYSRWFGTQYQPTVTFPFNRDYRANKIWYKMRVLSDRKWSAPVIRVPFNYDYAIGQLSRLKENRFQPYEGHYWAEFLRDMNDTSAQFLNIANPTTRAATALLNGRKLRGQVMIVQLTAVDGSVLTILRSVDAYFDYSGVTNP